MITPSQIPNPYVKPKWRASVGMMESVVAYNCRKYGMPRPVAAYPMWESAGNRAMDLSGRGNHGTFIGGPKWAGRGLDFDGVNDAIDVGMSDLADYSALTISAFVYMTAKTIDRVIVSQGAANNFALRYDVGTDEWYFQGHDGGYQYAKHHADVNLNTWTHIVGTYDGTTLRVYADGVVGSTTDTLGTPSANIGSTHIGNNLPTGNREWVGLIDEVCIFNTTLSAAQIKFLYDNPYFMYRMPEELYGYAAEAGNIINKQIELGTDDCYEDDDTTATLDTDNVYVGYLTPSAYDIGLRWQSINIPQGASITSAKLSIYLYADTGTLSANIRGIDEDNTLTWATDDRPSQRDKTSATITANEANWSNWVVQDWAYIDITSVIQEIIDRGGWSANNDLAIVIEDTAGTGANYIAMRAYELAGNLHGAKLEIEYGDAGITIPVIIHHLREQGIL